jgi:hypothetical protein
MYSILFGMFFNCALFWNLAATWFDDNYQWPFCTYHHRFWAYVSMWNSGSEFSQFYLD